VAPGRKRQLSGQSVAVALVSGFPSMSSLALARLMSSMLYGVKSWESRYDHSRNDFIEHSHAARGLFSGKTRQSSRSHAWSYCVALEVPKFGKRFF
jgi:hypothetical protein